MDLCQQLILQLTHAIYTATATLSTPPQFLPPSPSLSPGLSSKAAEPPPCTPWLDARPLRKSGSGCDRTGRRCPSLWDPCASSSLSAHNCETCKWKPLLLSHAMVHAADASTVHAATRPYDAQPQQLCPVQPAFPIGTPPRSLTLICAKFPI